MDKIEKERVIFLLEQDIRLLEAEYSTLIKKDGNFNTLKDIKNRIKKAADSLKAMYD